jgi:hypothetical protein
VPLDGAVHAEFDSDARLERRAPVYAVDFRNARP